MCFASVLSINNICVNTYTISMLHCCLVISYPWELCSVFAVPWAFLVTHYLLAFQFVFQVLNWMKTYTMTGTKICQDIFCWTLNGRAQFVALHKFCTLFFPLTLCQNPGHESYVSQSFYWKGDSSHVSNWFGWAWVQCCNVSIDYITPGNPSNSRRKHAQTGNVLGLVVRLDDPRSKWNAAWQMCLSESALVNYYLNFGASFVEEENESIQNSAKVRGNWILEHHGQNFRPGYCIFWESSCILLPYPVRNSYFHFNGLLKTWIL